MLGHYANEWGHVRVGRQVGDLAVRRSVDAIWGSDTSSLTAFSGVKPLGVRCILEQTVGHPRAWNPILTEKRALVARREGREGLPSSLTGCRTARFRLARRRQTTRACACCFSDISGFGRAR